MRILPLFVLMLLHTSSGKGQSHRNDTSPFKQSFSFCLGVSTLFSEKEGLGAHLGASLNLYKGLGIAVGGRRFHYLSPDIPEGYNDHALIFGNNGKVYNKLEAAYALVTYEWFRPLHRSS